MVEEEEKEESKTFGRKLVWIQNNKQGDNPEITFKEKWAQKWQEYKEGDLQRYSDRLAQYKQNKQAYDDEKKQKQEQQQRS